MIGGYRGRTVSEDTDATLMLHRQDWHIGYLPQVHVRLAPVTNWTHLYSQRVRWQRGELEVVAVNLDRLLANPLRQNLFWGWALRLRMQKDHSLALPRLVWVFLIFMLGLFGYSITLIMQAMVIMYALYVILEIGQIGVAYFFSRKSERQLIRLHFPFVLFLPLYRMATFWYRMSGVMLALHELPAWNVQGTGKPSDVSRMAISHVQDFIKAISRFWAE
jgi:cellulose synthase/poly-beta-1,6-N-acetylglucosamine synthase-like glycosyltransferase